MKNGPIEMRKRVAVIEPPNQTYVLFQSIKQLMLFWKGYVKIYRVLVVVYYTSFYRYK